jgi:hypothetical protein
MNLQFGNIFAGEAVWSSKEDHKSPINDLAVAPGQFPIGRSALGWKRSSNRFDYESTIRA